MLTAHRDRLWAGGGAVGTIALLLLGYLLFISPQYAETTKLRAEAVAGQQHLTTLEHRLVELRQQNGDLERYRAQLARDRQALPTDSGLADFMRELEAAGTGTGVSVTGLLVGSPTGTAGNAEIFVLPVTLVASGTGQRVSAFLDQLQQVQPRAVLVNNVSVVPEGISGTLADAVTLTINLSLFIAPPPGAAKPGQDAGPGAGAGTGQTGSGVADQAGADAAVQLPS
jgi:Tfp pilus assembly protein PilO